MNARTAINQAYRDARYTLSAHRLDQLPADLGVEVAFAGRSNAGKSSAINALTGQKALARTSKTPGRTQQIVIFELDPQRRIADLPGYGFAKVPEKLRAHWRTTLQRYFDTRASLRGVVLLVDIRHPMKPFDQQMLAWCDHHGVPCHVVLTKADKLKRGPAQAALLQVRKQLPAGSTAQTFSAKSGDGLEALVDTLNRWYAWDTSAGDSQGDNPGDTSGDTWGDTSGHSAGDSPGQSPEDKMAARNRGTTP